MDVRITTRHVDLTESFLLLAEDRTRKLTRYEPRLLAVDLLFEDDHGRLATEARADVPGRPALVARGAAEDRRASLDRALRKLRRQLRRESSKRVTQRNVRPAAPSDPLVLE